MKKIAYIELDTHAEIAANFMELMNDSKEFSVDYYFSKKIIKQIGKQNSNIFLTDNSEVLNQIKNQNYDLVIIGTVHRYFNIFEEITQKFNTSVIVHNLNFTHISQLQLLKNIFKKDFRYRIKLLIKEGLLSAPNVFKKAKNLLVLDESLVENKLNYLPIFFNEFNGEKTEEIFTIVVPGAVWQQRRDYRGILKKIKNSQHNFQIIFLGKAQGKELQWLKDFDTSTSLNVAKSTSIKYFTKKVPQSVFDEWMQKADVLWSPIQTKTEFFSNEEIYGKTKMTGNIGDAIKYGKMAIFPENYVADYGFIIPEEKEVLQQFQKLKDIDFDFQSKYKKEIVLKNLEKTLFDLL